MIIVRNSEIFAELSNMYVCVCQAVTSKQLAVTIAQGATTMKALRNELGVATCCGKCARDVRSQLQQSCGNPGGCACAARS